MGDTNTDDEAEPTTDASEEDGAEARCFVIQHHEASSEHWDFRLEHRGALLSWAVPKGPSTDPDDKRLAVRTDDHSLDDADFEGKIPDGEYGAGSVIVWDTGTWCPNPDDDEDVDAMIDDALEAGHLSFEIDGEKLHGGYVLQRFGDEDDQWLLIKEDDAEADARRRPTSTQRESVLSSKTVDDIDDTDGADR